MGVTITAAPAMGRAEPRDLMRQARIHMAHAFGYIDAEAELLYRARRPAPTGRDVPARRIRYSTSRLLLQSVPTDTEVLRHCTRLHPLATLTSQTRCEARWGVVSRKVTEFGSDRLSLVPESPS